MRVPGSTRKSSRRWLVLGGVVLALIVGALGTAKRSVAQVDGRMLALGSELFVSESLGAGVHEVRLNGRAAFAASVTTEASAERTLAWIRASCESTAIDVPAILAQAEQPPTIDATGATVSEHRDGPEFYVACLAAPESTFLERLSRFAASSDLGALGSYRFFYGRELEDGVSVGAVWTGESFVIDGMFPARGDVPGSDPVFVRRPRGVRSFAIEDASAGRRVVGFVVSEGTSSAYAGEAEEELEEQGFAVSRARSSTGAIVLHAERGRSHVSIVVDPALTEDRAGVTVIEAP